MFGIIGQILVGNWGFLVAVVIGLLFLIYQKLSTISSLLKQSTTTKKVG